MADVDGSTWKVGQLARLTGLTGRTLHHYDQLGLLSPSARTPSGHRLYDEPDVQRLYRIVALRGLGLPLEVIGELAALHQRWEQHGGPSPEQVDYIRRANAASS